MITLRISRGAFSCFQFGAVTALVLLAVIHVVCERVYGDSMITKLMALFDPVNEASITTVFSMLNLLLSSTLLYVIYLNTKCRREPLSRYWLILGLVFLALSVDEVAQVHERGGNLLVKTETFDPADDFHPDFVVTGIFAVAVFVVVTPFLWQLDRKTLVLFLVAGGIFVSGAVGLEVVELVMLRQGIATEGDLLLDMRSIVEEACEMYGIALFNFTLFGLVPRIVLEPIQKRAMQKRSPEPAHVLA